MGRVKMQVESEIGFGIELNAQIEGITNEKDIENVADGLRNSLKTAKEKQAKLMGMEKIEGIPLGKVIEAFEALDATEPLGERPSQEDIERFSKKISEILGLTPTTHEK